MFWAFSFFLLWWSFSFFLPKSQVTELGISATRLLDGPPERSTGSAMTTGRREDDSLVGARSSFSQKPSAESSVVER